MYVRFLALFAILFLVPQNLWARIHTVARNVATVVHLQDGDEIELADLPNDWAFSRVVLGVNSVPSVQLSGMLVMNNCAHDLHGYYDEVAFAYTGENKVVYHGPAQNLPVQWWADASPVISPCKSYSEMTRADSIYAILYDFADSVYLDKIKDYNDLGERNTEMIFEGRFGYFKITKLPDWFYNNIHVLIEPLDGRKLKGAAFTGGAMVKVEGYSSNFVIEQKTLHAPSFELVFTESRKVRLRWWAEVGVPSEKFIPAKETALSSDSVEVEYSYDDNFYGNTSVKIVYDKRKFADGKFPVVKKYSFNPLGPDKSKNVWVRGPVYDIDAKLNPGDSAVIAIPLNFVYQPDKDTVVLGHFVDEENRWIDEPVDSVVDGYAYAKFARGKNAIGIGLKGMTTFADPNVLMCTMLSKTCKKFVDGSFDYIAGFAEGVESVARGIFDFLRDLACPSPGKLARMFVSEDKKSWSVDNSDRFLGHYMSYFDHEKIRDVLKSRSLKKLSDPYPECNEDEEICKWRRTRDNLDFLLAKRLTSLIYIGSGLGFELKDGKGVISINNWDPKIIDIKPDKIEVLNEIGYYDFDDYFMVSSGFIEDAAEFIKGVKKCYKSVDISGRIIEKYTDIFDGKSLLSTSNTCSKVLGFLTDPVDWSSDVSDCADFMASDLSIIKSHEGKLIAISEAMARLSLLAWLQKENGFRSYVLMRYNSAYKGIRSWLELAGPFLDYNNIVIKAYGSLALFEYMYYGGSECLSVLNGGLNRHYGYNGGYSEGTGYSQYIWEDVPYILAVLKDLYKSKDESEKFSVNENFLKSPDYMFEFSRPVGIVHDNGEKTHYGLIPVEVDDGVTYNPDYRVWAKLKDDPKYIAMWEKYPPKDDGQFNVLSQFGIPNIPELKYIIGGTLDVPDRGTLWGDFMDGIGMITAVGKDEDTVALSMVAENGRMWTYGQSHDQQDNLSITLTSSKKGFLIQDPGYSGFDKRSKTDMFHNYLDHNVLTDDFGQDDNKYIPPQDLVSRAHSFAGDFPGAEMYQTMFFFEALMSTKPLDYKFTVEGGHAATVLDKHINEPQNGIIGYTAKTKIGGKIENHRTIMYFGENFWVIDRPNAYGLKWLANAPMNEWIKLKNAGVHLYVNSGYEVDLWRRTGQEGDNNVLQNGVRTDFVSEEGKSPYYLQNYSYTTVESHNTNFVMTYALGDETFTNDDYSHQASTFWIPSPCYVNSTGTKRVIVPAFTYPSLKICDCLPKGECYGNAFSSGITMLEKTAPGVWTTRWVLDGDMYAYENGTQIPISSATVSWSYYVYELPDGTSMSDRYSGHYLPALPILLR